MYSDKKNVLELVALLIAHEVKNIVVCPGSRNSPIVHTLVNHPYFNCHNITDERSAAFFALGRALHGGRPAAVCCTSGSALVNMHPAIAEAYYQQVPLLVISADRPQAWIGQMDGQTLPQPGVFGNLVKKSVNLPEIHTDNDLWHCNRIINEALLELNHHGKGPVHINVPLSEPLFNFDVSELPQPRVITRYQGLNQYDRDYDDLIERLNKYTRRMMIVGQMTMIYEFEKRISKLIYRHFTWFGEHTANRTIPGFPMKNFDAILYTLSEEDKEKMRPELVITYGGHIVSRRLKNYLRAFPPEEHWHVSTDGETPDMFGALTTAIEMDPLEFLEKIAYLLENKPMTYPMQWEQLSKNTPEPQLPYSQISAVGSVLRALPQNCALHLGNSSTVRYAQLFPLPETIEICCNRGVSGIEGSLSTALGYASSSEKVNFILLGDLSFFYDMNALWNNNVYQNVRIVLFNNGGGEIFQALPGLNMNKETYNAVTGTHSATARAWVEGRGFAYYSARNETELAQVLPAFTSAEVALMPMFLEVFTNREQDVELLKNYFHGLKEW